MFGSQIQAQTLNISFGLVQSNVQWKTGLNRAVERYGVTSFQEPREDIVFSVGLKYLERENVSFRSEFSYYHSGGSLAVYEEPSISTIIKWDLAKSNFSIPYVSLQNYVDLVLFQQDRIRLEGLAGIHLDYILTKEDKSAPLGDLSAPIQILYQYDALNRLNFGPSFGGRYIYEFKEISLGLQYVYSPRTLQLGSYKASDEAITNGQELVEFEVTERVSFIQLTFGYNLKKNKKS
jgi:hypothetical protein